MGLLDTGQHGGREPEAPFGQVAGQLVEVGPLGHPGVDQFGDPGQLGR